MNINLFAMAGLAVAIVCLFLAGLIFLNARKFLHHLWGWFNISIGIYGLGTFIVGISTSYQHAFVGWKITLLGVAMAPTLFYHVVCEFCHIKNRKVLLFYYVFGVSLIFFLFTTNLFFHSLKFVFNQFFYIKATTFFNLYFLFWSLIVFHSFKCLYEYIKCEIGLVVMQGRNLFWGMLFGFLGGITINLPAWGFNIYPAWHFFVCIYAVLSTYAIFRYRLMDLRVVVTRLGVFIAVYSLVLGLPFWLGWHMFGLGRWLVPVAFMAVLATVGPFIYIYMQQKAEAKILKEQRNYQETLRKMSVGMGRIRDLDQLLKVIVFILTRSVRMEHAEVFMLDDSDRKYHLRAMRKSRNSSVEVPQVLPVDSVLSGYFVRNSAPLVFDEVRQKGEESGGQSWSEIKEAMQAVQAELAFPVYIDNDLEAIVMMGKKEKEPGYSGDDIAVFSILANQAGLAIENAKSYEDMQRTQEKLFQAEKMATIGFLAGGISHQLRNRLASFVFYADFASKNVAAYRDRVLPAGVCDETLGFLGKISGGIGSSREVLNGILNYVADRESRIAISLKKLVASSIEFIGFKIQPGSVVFEEQIQDDVPPVMGNFAQLQEVLFNIIDNAYHSLMEKRAVDAGYRPQISFSAVRNGGMVRLTVADNGTGIRPEDMRRLFTPLFSTKKKARQGHGLGIYIMRQIVEKNHGGRIAFSSEYGQGVRVDIDLPVAEASA